MPDTKLKRGVLLRFKDKSILITGATLQVDGGTRLLV